MQNQSSVSNENELAGIDEFDGEVAERRISNRTVLITFFLLFAFVPVAYVFRECTFVKGARAMVPGFSLHLAFCFVCFLAMVHAALIWPISNLVYTQIEEKTIPAFRILIVTLMLSVPLLSFSYYEGSLKDTMDLLEFFLSVVPPVVIAAFFFEAGRNAIATSFFLSLAIFVPLYFLNDILSPFTVAFQYASTSPVLYVLRTVFPVGAVWFAVSRACPVIADKAPKENRLRNWIFGAWGIFLYTVVATWFLPMAVAYVDKKAVVWPTDFWWITQMGAILFLLVRTKWGYGLTKACASIAAANAILSIVLFFSRFELSFWALFNFAEGLSIAGFYLWLIYRLPTFKAQFQNFS